MVYKQNPDRYFSNLEDNKFQEFIDKNKFFNIRMKQIEPLKNLFGNILARPMYFDGEFNYWIETEFTPYFKPGNVLKPFAYSIPLRQDTTVTDLGKIETVQKYMFWSDEYYYIHDDEGNIEYDPEYPDGINPFGRLPFVEIRKDMAVDEYWPQGAIDLVEANIAVNVALSNLNYISHFQAFNQPVGRGIDDEAAANLRVGASRLISLSDPDMDLSLLSYSPQITAAIEAIKFNVEAIANMYNVNVKFSLDGNPASGFSLLVQNIDLLEAREYDVEISEYYEQEIYKVIQVQDEVLNLGYKLPKLEGETNLIIDFAEINFPVNQDEQQKKDDWQIQNNVITPIDVIQREQGLSEDEAMERWEKNKQLNEKLTSWQSALKTTLEQEGAVIEPTKPATEEG